MADQQNLNIYQKLAKIRKQVEVIQRNRKIEYGSIFDGDIVDMQLCCDCFDDLVNECKVSPIIEVSDDDE